MDHSNLDLILAVDDPEPTFNLRLIEAVRHSPCLYDQNDRQYRTVEFKIKVWSRLAMALGYEGDKNMLANRWKQLRDKYGKEKKKYKDTGEPPTWQYYKALHFLDPHMTDRGKEGGRFGKDGKLPAVSDLSFASNLIQEVQLQPCLYDSRDAKYRQTEYRNMAWSNISKNLKYPGDVNSIAKQWKTLRDHYVRERRMIAEGLREESSWELYGQMQWMQSYVVEREKARETSRMLKRSRRDSDDGNLSDDAYLDDTLGGFINPRSKRGAPDVLLDGDSAFSASAVSDLRSLPDHARALAKMQIEQMMTSYGAQQIMNTQIEYDTK